MDGGFYFYCVMMSTKTDGKIHIPNREQPTLCFLHVDQNTLGERRVSLKYTKAKTDRIHSLLLHFNVRRIHEDICKI